MRILVFTSLYPNNIWPNHGVFIKERVIQIAKLNGCKVKVVAPVPYFPRVKVNWRWRFTQVVCEELRDGIEVHHPRYFMTPKLGMTWYGVLMFLSALSTVKRVRQRFDFDLIDAHFIYPDGFAAVLLGRFFKKPVVVSARGSDINAYSQVPVIKELLRYTLKSASRVVAVSQALKRAIIDLDTPEKKITVIPNGVDVKKFRPVPKVQARRELNLQNQRIILSVGNLTPNKGFDLLIRSMKTLADDLHEQTVRLIIIGDGPYRSQLQKTITSLKLSTRVDLVGPVPHEKLYLWYSAADVFCLASNREGWPNVLLESLACGTPVVATAVGGIPEIICSAELGLLTYRDEVTMAATLRAALTKNWQISTLVEHARNHTWERTASAVARVFESALSGDTMPFPESPANQAIPT